MLKNTKPISDQHARFIETARSLGCDEDEGAFDEKLKAIARQRPSQKDEATKPTGSSDHNAEG